jgi:squalene-hopene/tetraprenyl-beta-curcumene cyclase
MQPVTNSIKHSEIFEESEQRANRILALLQEKRLSEPVRSGAMDALDWSICKATHFFRQALRDAGCWSDFQGIAAGGRDWISAYVGWSLKGADTDFDVYVPQVTRLIIEDRYPSGAWGYRPGLPVDMDSTSWATLFLQQTKAEWDRQKTINVLLGHQDVKTGGIRTYLGPQFGIAEYVGASPADNLSGWCDAHICISGVALQALIACGLDRHHPSIDKLVQFIRASQHSNGYWNAYWYHGKTYATTQCVQALLQAGEMLESPTLQRARYWIETTQLPDGSWNDGVDGVPGRVVDTALAICAGLNLHAAASFEKAIAWLIEKQSPDGSWASLPILQLPAANEHAPWNVKEWPETGVTLTQGVCIPDYNCYFTTATALQALVAWRHRVAKN